MKIYKYCFYRFVRMWKKTWFRDANLGLGLEPKDNSPAIFISSMSMVSLIQISNINTILIIPVTLLQKQLSANILAAIIFVVGIINLFFLNDAQLYSDAETRWKDEPQRKKTIHKWLVLVFCVVSMVLFFVSINLVYAPHSLTIPYWGNDWGGKVQV